MANPFEHRKTLMNTISRFLTACAFALAGTAVHAHAAVEQQQCATATCFQLTPVAKPGAQAFIAQDGASRTPQGQRVAENGASRTPQGHLLDTRTA
jgi:hypothetical protein